MSDHPLTDREDEPEIPDRYGWSNRDQSVVATAIQLLGKILRAPFTTPAQMASVAKLLHVLHRLPQRSVNMTLSIDLCGPRRRFGEHEIYHFWQMNVVDDEIEISSGGHFYRESTGGDTFTCMQWNAAPGFEPDYGDYLSGLQIVDDAQPYDQEVAALDLAQPGYKLDVSDDDNPLLTEDGDAEEEPVPESAPPGEAEYSEAEQELAAMVDEEQARQRGCLYSPRPETCQFCGCDLNTRSFFVDGRVQASIAFASMCADCAIVHGAGIGWGKGQLYRRQTDGEWLLVAGFGPPDESCPT